MKPMHFSPGFLPSLAGIPSSLSIRGDDGISAPLACALLETGVADQRDLMVSRDERDLAVRALSRWWADRTKDLGVITWSLLIQRIESTPFECGLNPDHLYFCLLPLDHNETPTVFVGPALLHLEDLSPGFGQSVLELLYCAFRFLPESFLPRHGLDIAEWLHWDGCESDHAFHEMVQKNGLEEEYGHEVATYADLFGDMPRWAFTPSLHRKRRSLVRAARKDEFARQAIALCDCIHSIVWRPDFDLDASTIGLGAYGIESFNSSVLVRWLHEDSLDRLYDDYGNHLWEGGEAVEFVDLHGIEPTPDALAKYLRRTDQMLELARAVDKLLQLLMSQTSRPRIEVFA